MNRVTIINADVLEGLRGMADESVHCVVTSPPYWGLRDYGIEPVVWGGDKGCRHEWGEEIVIGQAGGPPSQTLEGGKDTQHKATRFRSGSSFCRLCEGWRGSLGLEPTIELYVDHLVLIFREVRRVLRKDGTLWLNLGSSYASGMRSSYDSDRKYGNARASDKRPPTPANLKPKDLIVVPAMVALALQADGWWLRSDIIWAKPNPMPESCTDRPTTAHEYIFLLTKSAHYFYDAEAIKETATALPKGCGKNSREFQDRDINHPEIPKINISHYRKELRSAIESRHRSSIVGGQSMQDSPNGSRNLRSVWEIATVPFPQAHFATFPPAIPERCIKAGTSEKGCCPKCGAPWERVLQRLDSGKTQKMTDSWDTGQGSHGTIHRDGREKGKPNQPVMVNHTIGWLPTCNHYPRTDEWREYIKAKPGKELTPAQEAENEKICHLRAELVEFWAPMPVVPAVCLDPFAGAGTTGLVAAKLSRDAVLVEIKPEYCGMSEKRIKKDLGMLVEIHYD